MKTNELITKIRSVVRMVAPPAKGLLEQAANTLETQQKHIAELEAERRWIPVTERLPEAETEVLVQYNRNGHKGITTAIYEDGSIYTADSEWFWPERECFCEYDEEMDDYKVPQGWWEFRHFNPDDVYNNVVDMPVTHWMPLPEPPKEDVKC